MCTIWISLLHLPVGKITLKSLQEFRDANKNVQAPSVVRLWVEVSTVSIAETQASGVEYSEIILARKWSRWLPLGPPIPEHPSMTSISSVPFCCLYGPLKYSQKLKRIGMQIMLHLVTILSEPLVFAKVQVLNMMHLDLKWVICQGTKALSRYGKAAGQVYITHGKCYVLGEKPDTWEDGSRNLVMVGKEDAGSRSTAIPPHWPHTWHLRGQTGNNRMWEPEISSLPWS